MLLFLNELLHFRLIDVVDIVVVAYLLYELYMLIRGTPAVNVVIGITTIYILWKLVDLSGMDLLSEIIGQFISVGVIALIIVFQQEIRKFLLLLGSQGGILTGNHRRFLFWRVNDLSRRSLNIDEVADACFEMSETLTGALIILTGKNELKEVILTGSNFQSQVQKDLIKTIFFKNSPLHDGALIITRNQIVAARCILPVSTRTNLDDDLGLRHRSALGITESSDAIALVVSEQTGQITYVERGVMQRNIDRNTLVTQLKFNFA
ncbi:MAG: TIGR00159 family protein [Bacteroidetes bacterium HGW-Bacteroidetes-6]|jgi:uncharacterized protein (TIGR00159 family)|nr:MAG: TIGR00159 family protein [Bacteroidetes bacterium HGW-Bacteroidetes-6]